MSVFLILYLPIWTKDNWEGDPVCTGCKSLNVVPTKMFCENAFGDHSPFTKQTKNQTNKTNKMTTKILIKN